MEAISHGRLRLRWGRRGRRLLPVAMLAALGLAAGPAAAAGPAWLNEINRYREAAGLSAVTDQPAWDLGIEHHLTYLEKTPSSYFVGAYRSAHTENPQSPYYTPDGAQEAASSDLDEGGARSPLAAVDVWLAAPFHAIGMLRAQLTQVALADDPATGYAGLDVIHGIDPTAPAQTAPVLFPGPGMTTNLSAFGGESPDPLETCGWQGQHAGLPLIALLTAAPDPHLSASLAGPGGIASSAAGGLCVVDENTYRSTDPVYGPTGAEILQGDHAVLLIPHRPLANGAYTASITQPGQPAITWSFREYVPPPPHAGVTVAAPARLPAGHRVIVAFSSPRAFRMTLVLRVPHGRILARLNWRLRAGQWSFIVPLPRAATRRRHRVAVAFTFHLGRRRIVLTRTITFV